MIGIMMSLTSEVTIFPKAEPIMTQTARSMTFPFMAKSLNSFRMRIVRKDYEIGYSHYRKYKIYSSISISERSTMAILRRNYDRIQSSVFRVSVSMNVSSSVIFCTPRILCLLSVSFLKWQSLQNVRACPWACCEARISCTHSFVAAELISTARSHIPRYFGTSS